MVIVCESSKEGEVIEEERRKIKFGILQRPRKWWYYVWKDWGDFVPKLALKYVDISNENHFQEKMFFCSHAHQAYVIEKR